MEKAIDIKEVYKKLKAIERSMVTKEELDSALESVMIISNEDAMSQIQGSEKDIKSGKTKKVKSIKDLE